MIEAQMVRRMALRGAVLAPFVVAALGAAGGWLWAGSAAVGLAMTIGNLWLSARLIGPDDSQTHASSRRDRC